MTDDQYALLHAIEEDGGVSCGDTEPVDLKDFDSFNKACAEFEAMAALGWVKLRYSHPRHCAVDVQPAGREAMRAHVEQR